MKALITLNEYSAFFFNTHMIVLFSILAKYNDIVTQVSSSYWRNSLSTLLLISPIVLTFYTCVYKKSRFYTINIFSIVVSTLFFANYLSVWGIAFYQGYSVPYSSFSDGSGIKPVEVYLTDEKQAYFDQKKVDFSELCWLETEGERIIFTKNNVENKLETFVLNIDSIELLRYPDQAAWSCPYVSH